MSEQVITTLIIAFFASLAPTIAAFAALMVSRSTDHKSDVLLNKTTEIHTLTNSNLARVTESLNLAHAEIESLKKIVLNLTDSKVIADRVVEKLAEKIPGVSP